GAEAPKCSMETARPAKPRYLCHDWATPASTDTRARTSDGRTSSRYSFGCSSNHSLHGIDTTRFAVPDDSRYFTVPPVLATLGTVSILMYGRDSYVASL